jgi:hypothetical protein
VGHGGLGDPEPTGRGGEATQFRHDDEYLKLGKGHLENSNA